MFSRVKLSRMQLTFILGRWQVKFARFFQRDQFNDFETASFLFSDTRWSKKKGDRKRIEDKFSAKSRIVRMLFVVTPLSFEKMIENS